MVDYDPCTKELSPLQLLLSSNCRLGPIGGGRSWVRELDDVDEPPFRVEEIGWTLSLTQDQAARGVVQL